MSKLRKIAEDGSEEVIENNTLSRYQTYSYSHTLIAASSTKVVDSLASNSTISSFRRSAITLNNKYKPIELPDGGTYVILIDGTSDSDFIINDIEWANVLAPYPGETLSNATLVNVGGTMNIIEPVAARFLGILQQAYVDLQCEPSGSFFLLKTSFIGYPHDGGLPEVIEDVKPFGFTLTDMQAKFDETGSNYSIEFFGIANGSAKHPAFQSVNSLSSSFNYDSNSIQSVVQSYADHINDKYDEFYKQLEEKIANSSGAVPLTDRGKQLEYVITVDEAYTDPSYIVNDQKPQVTPGGTPNSQDGNIAFPKSCTIDRALGIIVEHCTKIQEEAASSDDKSSTRYIPKILSTIESDDRPDGKFKIKYNIVRSRQFETSPIPSEQEDDLRREPMTVLEYDYMYTGANVDVIEFDMKMEMGLAFFQSLIAPSNIASVAQSSAEGSGGTAENSSERQGRRYLKNTPIMPPTHVNDPIVAHSQTPSALMGYKQALTKHAFNESISVKLKIVGDQSLLNKSIVTTSTDVNTTDLYSTPSLVKINIRMPNPDRTSAMDYSEPFWYDGLYRIIEIKNIFGSDGSFIQELDLYALPEKPNTESLSTDPRVDKIVQNDSQGFAKAVEGFA